MSKKKVTTPVNAWLESQIREIKGVRCLLAMKSVRADMKAHSDFVWPESGRVEAPDWEATDACGHGLHALGWGQGDASLFNHADDAKWLVVSVDISAGEVINLDDDKIKFRACDVVFCGERFAAAAYLVERGCMGVHYGTATAGYRGTATAGDGGTATAGDGGTATAGDGGTATAGYRGTLLITRYDSALGRYRITLAEVGIDGIEPGVKYILNADGKFVKAN